MIEVYKHTPLYRFLLFCNESGLERTVLDCGAGGDSPALGLFASYGYAPTGIEFDPAQLELSGSYAQAKGMDLNILQGDMRQLSFADGSFSFVYSYNSVFHMRKQEVITSIQEMKRVLKPGGLLFANFLTVNDFRCGEGVDLGEHQYEQFDDDLPVIHSYYRADEPDVMFKDMEVLYKEDRVLERLYNGERIRQGFVDYIAKK
ncbi:S-adenosylmethionine-dependent methyltransferase [Paenibacillus albidus]|uniref:S-adenosylmethionine-dependent methyltransferase n=1 Tax=Paenibacillus albidus TaxID=2041023 RepID=A0A917BZ01_9BACL|nr:class I SAM-dependent methyltransferase [Paenibacillus albidus]GGF64332.1 S-adenosylmethionine-dependent methyltransferase [Paenibacillus albidus]